MTEPEKRKDSQVEYPCNRCGKAMTPTVTNLIGIDGNGNITRGTTFLLECPHCGNVSLHPEHTDHEYLLPLALIKAGQIISDNRVIRE